MTSTQYNFEILPQGLSGISRLNFDHQLFILRMYVCHFYSPSISIGVTYSHSIGNSATARNAKVRKELEPSHLEK